MYVNTLPRHRNYRFSRDTEGVGGGGEGQPGGGPHGPGGAPIGTGSTGEGEGDKGKGGDEFKPITTKEDFENAIKRRINTVRAQYADYEGLKAAKAQLDDLLATTASDQEKAAAQARAEGFNEAMSTTVPKLVTTAFKAASVGQLTDDQVDAMLEDLDLVKYATDDGDPDWEKIKSKVEKLAVGGKGKGTPGLGQGGGHQPGGQVRKGESGAAEARKRFPDLVKTG